MRSRKKTSPVSVHVGTKAGKAPKGLLICPDCKSAFFKKAWHRMGTLAIPEDVDMPVTFKRCPACTMIAAGQYEGRIVLNNVPAAIARELENFIRNYGERARGQNPMHRVIDIKRDADLWEVTTTENQLAGKLARHIKNHFKGAKAKVHFAGDPYDVEEITIAFE